ncbi:MAG TPA: Hsp20/alpha crystallin family protein [Gaiellaceae bacterium]|jgi:HSP20 family protein
MPVLERWTPLREVELMEQRMRRMFPALITSPTTPAADILETRNEIVIELEVPGYEERDLDVEVSDHTLTVAGNRDLEKTSDEATVRLHERLASSFERTFQLPSRTDGEHLEATYGNGILTLRVPKTDQPKPHKVTVVRR